jgi:hemoglobin-like flavoprotein
MGSGSTPAQRAGIDAGPVPLEAAQSTMPAWCHAVLGPTLQATPTCSEEHRRLRDTGAVIAQDPDRFGEVLHRRLFGRMPELRLLFRSDLARHASQFGAMLTRILMLLDQRDTLARELAELGRRHRHYGATFVHYLGIGEALIDTLEELNGATFDLQARLAWSRLYSWIVYRLRHAPTWSEVE